MAKLHKRGTTALLTVYGPRERVEWMLRSDCHIIRRRASGTGHEDRGRVKPDLTIGDLRAILARRYPNASIHASMPDDFIPNPAAKHAAAVAAAQKRVAKATAKADAEKTAEATLLANVPADAALEPTAPLLAYLANAARNRHAVHDGRFRYVVNMARFHGGQTGGWLGTAIQADWHLSRDYAHKPALDAIADAVARLAFGTDTAAAERWHKALHG